MDRLGAEASDFLLNQAHTLSNVSDSKHSRSHIKSKEEQRTNKKLLENGINQQANTAPGNTRAIHQTGGSLGLQTSPRIFEGTVPNSRQEQRSPNTINSGANSKVGPHVQAKMLSAGDTNIVSAKSKDGSSSLALAGAGASPPVFPPPVALVSRAGLPESLPHIFGRSEKYVRPCWTRRGVSQTLLDEVAKTSLAARYRARRTRRTRRGCSA